MSNAQFSMRQTKVSDLVEIEAQEEQRIWSPSELLGDNPEALGPYLGAYAWTLLMDGKPIACIGVVPHWKGVAACWGVFSDDALKHPVVVARFARSGIETAEQRLGLRRIETTAPTRHEKAHRWLRHLGFTSEGVARSYGIDGSDHVHYARIH